ncbi:ABC transporter substrate-binding protein [Oceanobacter sp. 4_MG-2023]|uniref:ABC transporter substrate-binding protein n=1 Tax=Oceanobacter sp. 4_MG-2023 TaxID=3062623 RepID=UPI002736A87B|nr:extracellular solute-binding protein [Oceanobacter sp. 4_MG-2023]MDP2549158.1 extracellular solute-binding protein [Oceanobacter sp. 4_MG-2023]
MLYRHLLLPALLLLHTLTTSAQTITLMTSYPQPVVSAFQQAFEEQHPTLQLNVLWRMPFDALPYLLQPQQGGVDVYWTPSQTNYLRLKAAGALAPLKLDRIGLPDHLDQTRLRDMDDTFIASEIAGYGLFINPQRLQQLAVAEPTSWHDLTNPRLRGTVALPVPSAVGYAPMLIDQLLQADGWQQGWNNWQAIAANSQLVDRRGSFVTDKVSTGQAAIGLTMDFFANATIASGADGRFVYPQQTAFNPAHIALMTDSRQPDAARLFIRFVLSEAGQQLLFHPDIRKLPIRPSVYQQAPDNIPNPFGLALDSRYNPAKGLSRRPLTNALFDAAITHNHPALIETSRLLHQASQLAAPEPENNPILQQAYALFHRLPVTEPDATSEILHDFQQREHNPAADARCQTLEQQWQGEFARQYAAAADLARQVIAGEATL